MAKKKAAVVEVEEIVTENSGLPPYSISDVQELDPVQITGDKNYRLGLIKSRLESMKESIIEKGGVQQAILIEPTEDDNVYSVVYGHYRHAGTLEANKDGAGLTIPVRITSRPLTDAERLKEQLSENLEREENSMIDKAKAAKALIDAGVPKIEIRNIFHSRRGAGGMEAISNSTLNIMLACLDLPKKIQTAIHVGQVGMAAAYELTRAYKEAKEKGKDPNEAITRIYDEAMEDSKREAEREEKDEEKLLEAEKKSAEDRKKVEDAVKEAEIKKTEAENSIKIVSEALAKSKEAFERKIQAQEAGDVEAKRKAEDDYKAASKLAEDAERVKAKKQKEAASAEERAKKLAEEMEARKNKLAQLRSESKGTVKQTAVAKAAAKENETSKRIDNQSFRKGVYDLAIASPFPKVTAFGQVLKAFGEGEISEGKMLSKLATLTGEKKDKAVAAK